MRAIGAARTWVVAAARRHPLAVDSAFGIVVSLLYMTAAVLGPEGPARPPDVGPAVLAAAIALVAIAVRRRWPVPVLLATGAASIAFVTADQEQPILLIVLAICAYTVATVTDRRTAWRAAGGLALLLYLVRGITDGRWWAPEMLGTLAWIGMATAFGDATRSRRAYVAAVEERARRAEETREEEARRRVAEERIRIARELHDVVAHHIAVINVQAGAAAHVLAERPEEVGPALAAIRRASDTVVKELASVVGVLRQPDDVATEPTRGLARVDDLLGTLAASGLPVRHQQHGVSRELPAMVDLAAYRIVQEALTNAHKHGAGGASLVVAYGPDAVVVEITNPVRADPRPAGRPGYGLVGMRERAAAAGGELTAGAGPRHSFVVRATLPTTNEPAASIAQYRP